MVPGKSIEELMRPKTGEGNAAQNARVALRRPVTPLQNRGPDRALGLVARGAPLGNLIQGTKTSFAQSGLRMHGADTGAWRRDFANRFKLGIKYFHERILRSDFHGVIYPIFHVNVVLGFKQRGAGLCLHRMSWVAKLTRQLMQASGSIFITFNRMINFRRHAIRPNLHGRFDKRVVAFFSLYR
jgi:hypothetical protein